MKGRTIMGSYLNLHLNLFPIYVLLLFLASSQGRPSARVKEHSLSQPYQVQRIVQIYNKISVRNSGDRYNSKTETTDEPMNNEIGQNLRVDENTDSKLSVYPPNEDEASHKEKHNEGDDDSHHIRGSSSPRPDKLSETKHNSDFQSFLYMNMDTQDEEDEDQSETSILDKFRVKILNELGYNVTTTSNRTFTKVKPQFSKEEYIRVYTQYMSNVKNRRERERDGLGATDRRKQAISRVQTFDDCSTDPPTYRAEGWKRQLKFDFRLKSGNGKDYRVRRAIVELPKECKIIDSDKNVTSSLTSFEDENRRTSSEEELYDELEENNINYADVTRIVSMWMVQHESSPFVVEAICSNRSSVVNGSRSSPSSNWATQPSKLKIVTRQISTRRFRRSAQKSTLNSFQNAKKYDGRDCSNLRHGKSCCRKSLKVKFSDLGITDEIMEPKEFDAHVCEGRCNQRWNAYSSTHAMFQHILHQNKGKKFAPRPCCTPTKLDQLDVIIIDPKSNTSRGPMQLQVVNLNNAVVKECGCS